jgi:hypothetical protein
MICNYCNHEIQPGEKIHISKQAGMEGTYHWSCFIDACKKNKKQSDDFSDSSFFGGDFDVPLLGAGDSASS